MATRKDMRRPGLVIPFQEPPPRPDYTASFASAINSTLPMGALTMRNKFLGWTAVVFSIQNWLGQSQDAQKSSPTPAYFAVLISIVSLVVVYLPLFMPQRDQLQGTATEAPAPA